MRKVGPGPLHRIEPKDIECYIATKLRPTKPTQPETNPQATTASKAKRKRGGTKKNTLAPKTVRNHLNTMHSVFDIGTRPRSKPRRPLGACPDALSAEGRKRLKEPRDSLDPTAPVPNTGSRRNRVGSGHHLRPSQNAAEILIQR
ncbi:MAG: hypothetical protein ACRDJX_11090 [Solirubrobacteraceae bacterium]